MEQHRITRVLACRCRARKQIQTFAALSGWKLSLDCDHRRDLAFLPQISRAQTAASWLKLDLGGATQHEEILVIEERRPCVSVRSRFCDHACAKLCILCAVSGIQGCLLLAATLRSVNGPGASVAPGQAFAQAPWYPDGYPVPYRSGVGAGHGGHVGQGGGRARALFSI